MSPVFETCLHHPRTGETFSTERNCYLNDPPLLIIRVLQPTTSAFALAILYDTTVVETNLYYDYCCSSLAKA